MEEDIYMRVFGPPLEHYTVIEASIKPGERLEIPVGDDPYGEPKSQLVIDDVKEYSEDPAYYEYSAEFQEPGQETVDEEKAWFIVEKGQKVCFARPVEELVSKPRLDKKTKIALGITAGVGVGLVVTVAGIKKIKGRNRDS